MVTLRLIAILIIGLVSTAWAGNWPSWRGPSGTAVSTETGLPVHWSDTENIAWKAPIRGLGISSPIVWGERVFVTSQLGGGESRRGPRLFQSGDAAAVRIHYLCWPVRSYASKIPRSTEWFLVTVLGPRWVMGLSFCQPFGWQNFRFQKSKCAITSRQKRGTHCCRKSANRFVGTFLAAPETRKSIVRLMTLLFLHPEHAQNNDHDSQRSSR